MRKIVGLRGENMLSLTQRVSDLTRRTALQDSLALSDIRESMRFPSHFFSGGAIRVLLSGPLRK